MKRVIAVSAAIACLSGCTTISVNKASSTSLKTGQRPELSIESFATVGSPIFSQFHYWSKTGYRLKSSVSIRIGLGRVIANNGDFVARATLDGENVYCTESLSYIDPLVGPFKTACFMDRDNDGRFEIVKAAPGMIWFESKLDEPIDFEVGEQITPRADAKNSELLYQGFSGKVLRLSYREYVNDMARPSYFQDVSYDIASLPAEITFKSVRLQVLSAGNNGMQYKVLSGF